MQKLNNRSVLKYARMEPEEVAKEIKSDRNANFGIYLIDKMQGRLEPLALHKIKEVFRVHGCDQTVFLETRSMLETMGVIKLMPDNSTLEFTTRGESIFKALIALKH